MTLVAGIIAPHPPVLIEQIGGKQLLEVKNTINALEKISAIVVDLKPDTLIFISPHSKITEGHFAIDMTPRFNGSFEKFGAGDLKLVVENDRETAEEIYQSCARFDLPVSKSVGANVDNLDWGVLVPYWFIGQGLPIVSLAISDLANEEHYRLGQAIYAAASTSEKNIVFVASGDLSHRLTHEGPYGFSALSSVFDEKVKEIVASGRLSELLNIDNSLSVPAAECGLRSFVALAGLLSKCEIETNILSYEGPFGIGYLVASLMVKGKGG